MHQKDVERFAFLHLCGTKDRHMLLEKERMTFSDFERLTYLTDFFGLTDYNLEIWGKFAEQFKNQFNALIEMYEEVDLEATEEMDFQKYGEENQQEMWVRDFCKDARNKDLCKWLEERVIEIYEKQGIELCESIEMS